MDQTPPQGDISLVLSASMLALFTSWIAYRFGFYRFPEKSKKTDEKIYFPEVAGAFLTFLITILVIVPILSVAWLSWKSGHLMNVPEENLDFLTKSKLNLFAIFLSGIAVGGYVCLLSSRARHAILRDGTYSGISANLYSLGLGLSAWFVSYPLVLVVNQAVSYLKAWLELPGSQNEQVAVRYLRMTTDHPILFLATAFLIVAVVPIIEELLFRGFLQTWLRQKLSLVPAIVLTSLIFSSFHYSSSQGLDNIELLSSLFILSCFLGFLYEKQQSIIAPIGLHMTFNAISVLMIFFNMEK